MAKFDCIVLGFGPGGMEAARALSHGGKKVAIVNKGPWGGVCLNCGCIPTKLLLGAIEPLRLLQDLARRKLAQGEIAVNYDKLQAHVKRHISAASANLATKYEALGVKLFQGAARLAGSGAVQIEGSGEILEGDAIIVATGSEPGFFPGLVADHQAVLDSTDLMFIEKAPQSLCVVGSGAIGLELADFFSAMGARITLVEAAAHIAPAEDADIAEALAQSLKKRGYEIRTGVAASRAATVNGGGQLELADGSILEAEKILIATGRSPNTSDLCCEAAGISLNRRGFIEVDEHLQAAPGIYAIGDVIGKALLAHAAIQQGNYAANHLMGNYTEPYASGPVPTCVYCHPSLMRAGLSATEAKGQGEAAVSISQFSVNPIAQAHAAPEGFVKAVWLDGQLAGMAAVGVNAAQLVTAAELLVAGGYNAANLQHLMVTHPSLDESLAWAIYQKPEKI